MAKQFKGRKLDKMIWDETLEKYFCPKCDSSKVYVKSGMFADLFVCENCGFESRSYVTVKEIAGNMQVVS